jgi:hypothetical protein
MAMRKRRADKRIHSDRLFEILAGLVDSPAWTDKLLKLKTGEDLAVNAEAFSGQDEDVAYLVRRFQLSYVLTLDEKNEIGDPEPVEGAKVFKIQSTRHPVICGYIEELPEDLGSGEGLD